MGNYKYRKIAESLKLLSLPYDEQVQCLPDFVDAPFEVLDTFYNAFLLMPSLIEDEIFTYQAIAEILRLHNLIEMTARNPDLSDLDEVQFSTFEEWNKIREMASEIVLMLGENQGKPDPKFI